MAIYRGGGGGGGEKTIYQKKKFVYTLEHIVKEHIVKSVAAEGAGFISKPQSSTQLSLFFILCFDGLSYSFLDLCVLRKGL